MDKGKKGPDRGIDGRLLFHDGDDQTKEIIFSVKSGRLHAAFVRDLCGVVAREKAQIGVMISFDEPTKQMRAEAASAGMYRSPWGRKPFPKIQLVTIADLLGGKSIEYPAQEAREDRTYRKGPAVETRTRAARQRLFK